MLPLQCSTPPGTTPMLLHMARPRILPNDDTLKAMWESGMTQEQIAQAIAERTHYAVSRSAVSVALSRAGLTKRVRYTSTLPWKLKQEHSDSYDAYMLRLAGRIEQGKPLSDDEQRRFDSWTRRLAEAGCVVHYEPRSKQGFWWVPRREGVDTGYIRRPDVD